MMLYGFLGAVIGLLIVISVQLGIISDRLKEGFPTEDEIEEELSELGRD
jgi:hypothetical protein